MLTVGSLADYLDELERFVCQHFFNFFIDVLEPFIDGRKRAFQVHFVDDKNEACAAAFRHRESVVHGTEFVNVHLNWVD